MEKQDLTFGSSVRELRKRKGMSLRELAKESDIDFTYLSKLESGKFPPPSEGVIHKLAEILGADPDELLTLAKKIDSSIQDYVVSSPETVKLLRALKDKEIDKADEYLQNIRESMTDDSQESRQTDKQ
jgi:transcriptional regulator with XRE-family HTH domain